MVQLFCTVLIVISPKLLLTGKVKIENLTRFVSRAKMERNDFCLCILLNFIFSIFMLGFWAVRKVAIKELIYELFTGKQNKNAKKKDVPFICVPNQY